LRTNPTRDFAEVVTRRRARIGGVKTSFSS
jgi:hypothetical protein